MWTEDDIKFMREALVLAKSAEGRTTPDPMVGAVLVKDGRIISMGYHGEVATPHAEAWAIQKASENPKGATLYLNLEPCNHYGNNPPCTEAIINAGVKKVIAAMKDPNPLVNGRGFAKLKNHGVEVEVGLLEDEANKLNEVFKTYITKKRPFIVMKTAMTIDGKIATKTGASRWVASPSSLDFAHHLRNLYDAMVVGVDTVLVDDPKLNIRRGTVIKHPVRIVLDTHAKTPLSADIFSSPGGKTVIAVGPKAPAKKVRALEKMGAEIISLPLSGKYVDVGALVKKLAKMKITSLLVEGGGEVNASFLAKKLVDKAHFVIVPKIFGGRDAKTPVEGEGIKLPAQAKWLKNVEIEKLGTDIIVTGYF
ncbi:MAG: bifunctional diaminohydroxyphosphoribosylaminopyrimidine deaminase/5-amino-6-(5-phosphoribosylamino)uracil reductase RibD [bacterium]